MPALLNTSPSLIESMMSLRKEVRLWRIFLLGIASGYPWLLIGSAMTSWLKDVGMSRSAIGAFGVIFVAYTLNFLWAPLVDHIRIPILDRLGHRRSWIVLCQVFLILFATLLALTGPGISVSITVVLCLGIAMASATQDLAIDAYRITIIREDEPELIGHGAALATCGWWTGFSLPGIVAFWASDHVGWGPVYFGMAATLGVVTLLVLWLFREPDRAQNPMPSRFPGLFGWFDKTYIDAVAEFFRRNGIQLALGLLAFIFLFKIGEAFLGRMVIVFYKEVGFTDTQIGLYSKGLGLLVTFVSSIAAGIYAGRFGAARGLLFAGIAMAATNLLFAWIAIAGPYAELYTLAVIADGITSAFSTVALVTFISYYTSRLHTATQYGALASLGNSSRTLLAASSGVLVDQLGGNWAMFFILTALMVTPSLLVLTWLARRVRDDTPVSI